METPMTTWAKRPNMMRQEVQFQGSSIVKGFDGTTVWQINSLTGSPTAQEITGPQADMTRQQAEFDGPLLGYKQRGYAIELIGTETFKNRPVHHLKITSKTGQVQQYYLDAESGLEVKTSIVMEQGGVKAELVNELSNYQKVNGFAIPFMMEQLMNGSVAARITLDKVEFNVPIEDALFRMPEKK
jgi:outer membrane lipoprotein-sorting protein